MKTQANKKLIFKKGTILELNDRKLFGIYGGGETIDNPPPSVVVNLSRIVLGGSDVRPTTILTLPNPANDNISFG